MRFLSDLLPAPNVSLDLGSTSLRWGTLFSGLGDFSQRLSVGSLLVSATASSGSGTTFVPGRLLNAYQGGDQTTYAFVNGLVAGIGLNDGPAALLGPFANNCLTNWKLRGGTMTSSKTGGATITNPDNCFQQTLQPSRLRAATTLANPDATTNTVVFEFADLGATLITHQTAFNYWTPYVQLTNAGVKVINIKVEYQLSGGSWVVLFDAPPTFTGLYHWHGPSLQSSAPVTGIRFTFTVAASITDCRIMELGWASSQSIQGVNMFGALTAKNTWAEDQTFNKAALASTISASVAIQHLGLLNAPVLATDASGNLIASTFPSAPVGGSGTAGYVARWTPNGITLGIGALQDTGSLVGIGKTPITTLDVLGSGAFSGSLSVVGGINSNTNIQVSGSDPRYILNDTDSPSDQKRADFVLAAGALYGRFYNDALSTSTNWLTVTRVPSSHLANNVTFTASGSPFWNANLMWHAGNDGTGSGLDADLLDGQHASAFALVSHTHPWSQITATPTTLAGYAILDAQPLDGDLTAIAGLSTTGYLRRSGTNAWALDATIPYGSISGTPAIPGVSGTVNTLAMFTAGGTAVGDSVLKQTGTTTLTFTGTTTNSFQVLDSTAVDALVGLQLLQQGVPRFSVYLNGASKDLFFQRYNAGGTPLGPVMTANWTTGIVNFQANPTSNGKPVVTVPVSGAVNYLPRWDATGVTLIDSGVYDDNSAIVMNRSAYVNGAVTIMRTGAAVSHLYLDADNAQGCNIFFRRNGPLTARWSMGVTASDPGSFFLNSYNTAGTGAVQVMTIGQGYGGAQFNVPVRVTPYDITVADFAQARFFRTTEGSFFGLETAANPGLLRMKLLGNTNYTVLQCSNNGDFYVGCPVLDNGGLLIGKRGVAAPVTGQVANIIVEQSKDSADPVFHSIYLGFALLPPHEAPIPPGFVDLKSMRLLAVSNKEDIMMSRGNTIEDQLPAGTKQGFFYINSCVGTPGAPTWRGIGSVPLMFNRGTGTLQAYIGTSWVPVVPAGGNGTVTSVGLTLDLYAVAPAAITTSGTMVGTLSNQNANWVLAGPVSGGVAKPAFRSLVAADIAPLLTNYSTGTGAADYVARWSSPGALATGALRDNGTSLSVGQAPSAAYLFWLSRTFAGTGSSHGIRVECNRSVAGASDADLGLSCYSTISHAGGTLSSHYDFYAQGTLTGAGTTTTFCGFRTGIGITDHTLTLRYGLKIDTATLAGAGGIGTEYGVYCDNLTPGTSRYGFRSRVDVGTTRYGLYFDGTAQNWFAGNVGIGSGRSIPAFPLDVNGDVRSTGFQDTSLLSAKSLATDSAGNIVASAFDDEAILDTHPASGALRFDRGPNKYAQSTLPGMAIGTGDYSVVITFRVPSTAQLVVSQSTSLFSVGGTAATSAGRLIGHFYSNATVTLSIFQYTAASVLGSSGSIVLTSLVGRTIQLAVIRKAGVLFAFVDGQSWTVTQPDQVALSVGGTSPDTYFNIGSQPGGNTYAVSEPIYSARLYNWALPGSELQALMLRGVAPEDALATTTPTITPTLLNGGFETATPPTTFGNWINNVSGASTVNVDSAFKHSGAFSCRLDVDTAGTGCGVRQPVVEAMRNYRISLWISTSKAAINSFQYNLNSSSDIIYTIPGGAPAGTFTFISFEKASGSVNVIGAGNFTLNRNAEDFQNGVIGYSRWFDDVTLERIGCLVDLDCGRGSGNILPDRQNRFPATVVGTAHQWTDLNPPLSGSGTPGKVPKFNASSFLVDSLLSDDGASVISNGSLYVIKPTQQSGSSISLSSAGGYTSGFSLQRYTPTGGAGGTPFSFNRWVWNCQAGDQLSGTGTNGSDLILTAHRDDGVLTATAMTLRRSDGRVDFAVPPTVAGNAISVPSSITWTVLGITTQGGLNTGHGAASSTTFKPFGTYDTVWSDYILPFKPSSYSMSLAQDSPATTNLQVGFQMATDVDYLVNVTTLMVFSLFDAASGISTRRYNQLKTALSVTGSATTYYVRVGYKLSSGADAALPQSGNLMGWTITFFP